MQTTTTTEVSIKTKTQTKKPGSGRTKGAYSFVKVPWRTLKNYVGRDTHVTISRLWAQDIGLLEGFCSNAQAIRKTRMAHGS